MQLKTIKRTVTYKMNAWLESITDESLRNDVRDNLLVSGGSITSLLLGEEVNDYDVYIQDRDVLLKLVNYYVKDEDGVEVWDGRNKKELIKKYSEGDYSVENSYSQMGCAIRNLGENQIKLYMDGSDTGGLKVDNVLESVKNAQEANTEVAKYRVTFLSPNAISLSDDIQIVIRFYGTPAEIHKTFDFIHATNYFTFKDGVVTNIPALESILTKQLHYQGSLYPLTSVIRTKKFLGRNWKINAGEYLKMMFQISLLDLTNIDVLEEQLIGIDVAYFGTLIKALRDHKAGNKDFVPTAEYMNTMINRIFNDEE